MKIFKLSSLICIIALCCSCSSSLTDQQLHQRKKGIVNACYTVVQYKCEDEKQRIQKYLNKQIQQEIITQQQKQVIQICIERTQSSQKWSN